MQKYPFSNATFSKFEIFLFKSKPFTGNVKINYITGKLIKKSDVHMVCFATGQEIAQPGK